MPLEDIVPPPELCAKIPDGTFAESSLIWFIWERNGKLSGYVVPREMKDQFANALPMILAALHKEFPAPTLEEILREMAKYPHRFNSLTCEADGERDFSASAFLPNLGNPGSTLVEYRDKNGATAALKLFLHDRREK
jgi:hypothetical protein